MIPLALLFLCEKSCILKLNCECLSSSESLLYSGDAQKTDGKSIKGGPT